MFDLEKKTRVMERTVWKMGVVAFQAEEGQLEALRRKSAWAVRRLVLLEWGESEGQWG